LSLASPPSSAQQQEIQVSTKQSQIILLDEPWPNDIKYDNEDGPSFQIDQPKQTNVVQRFLQRTSFKASFSKPKTKVQQKALINSNPVTKKRPKFDPQDFVKEEKDRVDEIRELMDAKDYNAALKSLMSDADADFHYFNKVKSETISTKHEEAFARRHGNLKCSTDDTKWTNNKTCLWHGETDRGFPLRCYNKCLNHPYENTANHLGVLLPRPLDFCAYHVRYCVETMKHGELPIRIRVPNEHALCNECFVLKTTVQPKTLNRIPGTRRPKTSTWKE
jgi:hypothetical protein